MKALKAAAKRLGVKKGAVKPNVPNLSLSQKLELFQAKGDHQARRSQHLLQR
jgi:hypothetical protein